MAGPVVERVAPGGAEALALLQRYYDELDATFPCGFDVARTVAAPAERLVPPTGAFLVARLAGVAVGCGAVLLDEDVAEIKRMWTDPAVRGRGVGRSLLTALEQQAAGLGATTVRLDTSAQLSEAISLYRSAGYAEVPAYNDNPYAAHWFAKRLGS